MNDSNLTEIDKYRLNKINKIKEYFNKEINERKDIINKLNKYIVGFDYLDKIFITLLIYYFIWYIKRSFTCYGNRYTSWYCRYFFNFNIYNKYRHK